MRKEDFVFDHKDDEHQDYWFRVTGNTKIELTNKHMEMCMVEVTDVVFSASDGAVGIKRLFPFNYDVVLSDDTALKELLASLTKEVMLKDMAEKLRNQAYIVGISPKTCWDNYYPDEVKTSVKWSEINKYLKAK